MDHIKEVIEQEKRMLRARIDAETAWLKEDLIGSLNKSRKNGKTIYYCYRGGAHRPRRTYLGEEGSEKMNAFWMNKALLRDIADLEHDLAVLCEATERLSRTNSRITSPAVCERSMTKGTTVIATEEPAMTMPERAVMQKGNGKVILERTYGDERYRKLLEWQNQKYPKNSMPMKDPEILTVDGTRVRSKDEGMSYNEYIARGIPFRYDSVVELRDEKGNVIEESPDFLIKCFNEKLIIHEHLGLLTEDWYVSKNWQKLHIYALNGFVLNKNLFLTSGSPKGGVDFRHIRNVIHQIELAFWQTY